ncbi:hypothetical protein G7074_01110 [Pedobacter sp. HDW13]|uniref:hypothetical protein n=1 Tax=Pedobacter sp. HDW13 TaxID=2714940 RepID=UPI00140BB983|nr:hypothetical protein [Pedobacter sp. HDW13]QIL38003.1 hypothetical protein G7074_01110 [Pedobacter sp. HDW13]
MNDLKKLEDLRMALLQKIKPATIDRNFCNLLSIKIFTAQNDYLSTRTLMQLFGLLPLDQGSLNPRAVDMLHKYTGCKLKLM